MMGSIPPRERGGIGRRTRLRIWLPRGNGSSTLPVRTRLIMRRSRALSRLLADSLWIAVLVAGSAGAAEDRFKLRVEAPRPTRFYLNDSSGKLWAPAGAIVYQRRDEQHFVVRNGFEILLPPGSYTLAAERGPEYRPFSTAFEARAGLERRIEVAVGRWVDMNRLGWYSGDLHNHRRLQDMPLLLLAEDLNLAPTLTDWIWEDRPSSTPPRTSDA